MIIRETYLEKIKNYIDKNIIKVIVGQRRIGKSYLLKMTMQHILSKNKRANIIFIDKELYDFDFIKDYHQLIAYIEEHINKSEKNYLFIDEIQDIIDFEKALRHFYNKENIDIYCTGSNANLLSGDLATLLSGRYIKIELNNLSYLEFLKFHELDNNDESLMKYLKWGGLPFIRHLEKNDNVIFNYLNNIISTIIYKDIIHRYKVRNTDFFDNLVKYIAANIGHLITAKRISDYLKSQKIDISTKVVLSYLQFLQNAFLVYRLKRRDLNSKIIFETNNKYYFEDWGLRNAIMGLNRFSIPDTLENVVFSHLKQLDYTISIGKIQQQEIDFVAEKQGQKIYIQVCYLLASEKVKEREFGNLLLIKDNYPKIVVSLDSVLIGSYKGIKHMHLRDFLCRENFD